MSKAVMPLSLHVDIAETYVFFACLLELEVQPCEYNGKVRYHHVPQGNRRDEKRHSLAASALLCLPLSHLGLDLVEKATGNISLAQKDFSANILTLPQKHGSSGTLPPREAFG